MDSDRLVGWYESVDDVPVIFHWNGAEWDERKDRPVNWSELPGPGWYPAPQDESLHRYWDGLNWISPLVNPQAHGRDFGRPEGVKSAHDARYHYGRPNRSTRKSIADLSAGEDPWLIVAVTGAGALVGWEDRLAIIKAGAMPGMMAGAMGGRHSVFYFTEVTGIEYNAGMMTGVLEVLTASYQGTGNKDYWRGTTRGRNEDSNDPWTLSNTLPLPKADYKRASEGLAELRGRIASVKAGRGAPQRPPPQPPAGGPEVATGAGGARQDAAERLRSLSKLHEEGLVTEDEFVAKRAELLKEL